MSILRSNVFREAFRTKVKHCVDQAQAADAISHPVVKGSSRELFTKGMLTPVLPPSVRMGTGQIVSSDGEHSGQIDIALYAPQIMPAALFDESNGLFPIEATLYTMEVKSTLTASSLKSALNNARSILALKRQRTTHRSVNLPANGLFELTSDTIPPVITLFAFGSDLSGGDFSELQRYKTYDAEWSTNPLIKAFCIAGRGYWYHSNEGWKYRQPTEDYGEIMSFLGGLANTLPKVLASKGSPDFGHYIDDESVPHILA